MIISRTPFRISFAGGGTDLAAFYRNEPGAVISTAIDKYMYVTVNKYFDENIILKYSRTELVPRVSAVRHPILRECLLRTGLTNGVEITSMADIVGGTGLGSSSSFTVGVLHALHAFKGEYRTAEQLAAGACEVEIERLKEPIGKQDQYIAAYGGFQFTEFRPDGKVRVDPLICPPGTLDRLSERLILLFTGITRKAGPLLRKARAKFSANAAVLRRMRDQAHDAKRDLQNGRVDGLGELLREAWELKKSLASGITNPYIDRAYETALKNGAVGGKILGAGGGGFLLLYCESPRRAKVLRALKGWREIPFRFEPEGSKIIYVSYEKNREVDLARPLSLRRAGRLGRGRVCEVVSGPDRGAMEGAGPQGRGQGGGRAGGGATGRPDGVRHGQRRLSGHGVAHRHRPVQNGGGGGTAAVGLYFAGG